MEEAQKESYWQRMFKPACVLETAIAAFLNQISKDIGYNKYDCMYI